MKEHKLETLVGKINKEHMVEEIVVHTIDGFRMVLKETKAGKWKIETAYRM